MTAPEEGLEIVGVRSKWPDEANDFTPWLARNLDLLGKVIGLSLKCIKEEKPVGPYFLDILAENTDSGERVAIENQLEETDHTHLGQVLTYAAGTDAKFAIWVAPDFVYEHAQAMHRLNEWKGSDIRFYGIKVEAVRTAADSDLEARFRKVVYPGGWNKELTLQSWEMPTVTRRYHDFFQPLINELRYIGFADTVTQRFNRSDRHFPSPSRQGTGYSASVNAWGGRNAAWVVLHIEAGDRELTEQVFDELKDDQESIESSLELAPNSQWEWLRFNGQSFSQIGLSRPGSIDDSPDKLEETRMWMLEILPKLKEVFEPRLQKLLG